MTEPHVDVAIGRLASRHRGLVTRAELGALGLSAGAIADRRRTGRLITVHRGVYAVGHIALPPLAREQAALLACGPGSVLSHGSAAAVWRLLAAADGPVHVTTGTHRRSVKGVHVHQSTALDPSEIRTREGLRVTAPARTLLDLAGSEGRAFDEAFARRIVTRAELGAAIATRRRGAGRLRAALDVGPAP